jgi:cell shape-determining protein MreC
VAVLAGGFFASQLKQRRDDLNSQLNATKDSLSKTETELTTAKKDRDNTSRELKDTNSKLDAVNSDLKKKDREIESERAGRQKLEDNLKDLNKQKEEVQVELDKYKKAIPPDLPPEQIQAKLKEFGDQLAALDSEKKVLNDKLLKLEEEKKKREENERLMKSGKPVPGISGHVVAVNPEWNFVVLDIGSKQGLFEQAGMIVYRGTKLVGKIKITSVEPSTAIADILPEWKQEDIQEGDTVIF